MSHLNPGPPDPALQRGLWIAMAIEAVFLAVGCVLFLQTEQPAWMVGAALVGSVPILWVLFKHDRDRRTRGSASSIVEDGRGRH